ncbi:MAG TPA: hypothetical protein VL422_10445 [Miltoncostaea sp.]|nr:hypothetical protein [Miltoncostaea sp.]
MTTEPKTTQDKQITVEVPEDRVAEFYAFYGRFLAGFPRRRGRHLGGPHHHGRGCGHHRHAAAKPTEGAPTDAGIQTA